MASLMVFTRDLRVRDNPALAAAAAESPDVIPLFVLDPAPPLRSSPNRTSFLHESLRDLDRSLGRLGSRLVVRRGDWVGEVLATAGAVDARSIHVAEDVSAFARRRIERLRTAAAPVGCEVVTHPGVTVVGPGDLHPAGGHEFKVFTPYYRRWLATPSRAPVASPRRLRLPEAAAGLAGVELLGGDVAGRAPHVIEGGESAGLRRAKAWAFEGLAAYGDRHDDLAADATSRLSAFLHFGCLSPGEIASRWRAREGAEPFLRQLCWRDFYHQVLAARPDASSADYRSRGDDWNVDDEAFAAWAAGRTGFPLVDAGMRQLLDEGFMHNRARLATASFLTKDLYVDWRLGAAHFMAHLVDGDVANNQLNWQWTAGTGTDPNPHRVFNPVVQGRRFDPDGAYIRRYVPELAEVGSGAIDVHWPDPDTRARIGYPAPLVDHREAIDAYRARLQQRGAR